MATPAEAATSRARTSASGVRGSLVPSVGSTSSTSEPSSWANETAYSRP